MNIKLNKHTNQLTSSRSINLMIVIGVVSVIGSLLIIMSRAASPYVSVEPENYSLSGNAFVVNDSGASGGKAIQFTIDSNSVNWWKPAQNTRWQWVLEGKVTSTDSARFDMYDIDLTDAMPADIQQDVVWAGGYKTTVTWPKGSNAGIIADLKSKGKKVVCYFDTGAFETYEPDAVLFPGKYGNNVREMNYLGPPEYADWDILGGKSSASDGSTFAGEYWLDLRESAWPALLPIISARMELAKTIGCDGVEGDQNNVYGNDKTFNITEAISLRWYREIYYQSHRYGLTAISKNGVELTDQQVTDPTNITYCKPGLCIPDGILNEECSQYKECSTLDIATSKGIWVGQVEYRGTVASVCPDAKANGRMAMKKPENYAVTQSIIFACWE